MANVTYFTNSVVSSIATNIKTLLRIPQSSKITLNNLISHFSDYENIKNETAIYLNGQLSEFIDGSYHISYVETKAFTSQSQLTKVSLGYAISMGEYPFPSTVQYFDAPVLTDCRSTSFQYNLISFNAPMLLNASQIAFSGNSNLRWVNLENCRCISAFARCTNLSYFNAPKVKELPGSCFASTQISQISLPMCIDVGDEAFYNTPITQISLECRSLGDCAFAECTQLSSVDIFGICAIETAAFRNCTSLSSFCFDNIYMIYSSAFKNCNIPISQSVIDWAYISSHAFYGNNTISKVEINSLWFNTRAFANCVNLHTLVTYAVEELDLYEYSLSSVYLYCNPPDLYNASNFTDVDIYIGSEYYSKYLLDSIWSQYSSQFQSVSLDHNKNIYAFEYQSYESTSFDFNGIENIRTCGFAEAQLTSAFLPSCINIYAQAFYSCSQLSKLDAPMVETILPEAFYGCSQLFQLSLPKVRRIGGWAFSKTSTYYTPLNLPECEEIGQQAFANCKISQLTLPKCKYIHQGAFTYCGISNISIPLVEFIGSNAFYYNQFQSITIDNCKIINGAAFESCGVREVHLSKCKFIGYNAFGNCWYLSKLYLNCSSVPLLSYSFDRCGLDNGTIFVRASLISEYEQTNAWSYYKGRFRAIEEVSL